MKHRILAALGRRLRDRVARRPPDFVLTREGRHDQFAGGSQIYMKRWYVLPRNKWLCLYLHKFEGSDEDRALHDHPARNFSLIIDGGYVEHTPEGSFERSAGDFVTRAATKLHRIQMHPEDDGIELTGRELPCWTLFVFLHKHRQWGFACDGGWISWTQFDHQGGCGEP